MMPTNFVMLDLIRASTHPPGRREAKIWMVGRVRLVLAMTIMWV
jgi:hypothetical protein